MSIIESPLELYEQYRDEEGYIDLDRATKDGLFASNMLRPEHRGSDRGVGLSESNQDASLKGWYDFSGPGDTQTAFLVRTNMFRNEEANYTDYAELIFEEIAKELGIRSPHYDLFKYKGQKGVLSQKLMKDDEELTPLSALSGIKSNQANVMLSQTDDILENALRLEGKSEEEIKAMKVSLRKVLILDTLTLNEDRHLGNIGLMKNAQTGEIELVVYDNEISLLLSKPRTDLRDTFDVTTQAENSTMIIGTDELSTATDTTVDIMDSVGYGDEDEKDDYEFADSYDELTAFLCKGAQIEMDSIFERVENRIKAKLPTKAKNIAKLAYRQKVKELDENLELRGYAAWDEVKEKRKCISIGDIGLTVGETIENERPQVYTAVKDLIEFSNDRENLLQK